MGSPTLSLVIPPPGSDVRPREGLSLPVPRSGDLALGALGFPAPKLVVPAPSSEVLPWEGLGR